MLIIHLRWHAKDLPTRAVTAGVDHVIMAFADSSFQAPLDPLVQSVGNMRAHFDPDTKMMLAVGGWGWSAGFPQAAATEASREAFAQRVANMLETMGYDGVDIDWEYPGGNGADYRQIPNAAKAADVENFPLLLLAVRRAIGNRVMSIATPGLEQDMIAFTPEQAPKIWEHVDFVNIMTYDLINRRDRVTKHHSDVHGSLVSVNHYLDVLGLPAEKANLGFAFYAKHFNLDPNVPCANGLGCQILPMEDAAGQDTFNRGVVTFERANYLPRPDPSSIQPSYDGACGLGSMTMCPHGACCSSAGYCGTSPDHCSANCQPLFGRCDNVAPSGESTEEMFQRAMRVGVTDGEMGGQYYFDRENNMFWSWDTVELMERKVREIVHARGLGGVFAWSGGQDSQDWSHLLALGRG